MHARQSADYFEMAQFLGADVHQKIFPFRVLAVQPLNRILHGGGEFTVRAAKLFKQHVAETWIRLIHSDGVHELFDMMIHERPRKERFAAGWTVNPAQLETFR